MLETMDLSRKMSRARYVEEVSRRQIQLRELGYQVYRQKHPVIIAFEGWDAAGKGGAIRRLTERLDPRGIHVWPIGPPQPDEQGRHYLYRFWERLPEPGTIAIFDRSWYGRVLVERVEGLIPKSDWKRAYGEIKEFERMLVDDGVRLVKLFLHIPPEEQLQRFAERLSNPYKRWKLTESDLRNHRRWDDYSDAIEDMFDHTSPKFAPWNAIYAEKKWVARVKVLETVTAALAAGVEVVPPPIDPEVKKMGGMAYIRREMTRTERKDRKR